MEECHIKRVWESRIAGAPCFKPRKEEKRLICTARTECHPIRAVYLMAGFCLMIMLTLFSMTLHANADAAALEDTISEEEPLINEWFHLQTDSRGYEELIPLHTVTSVGRENVRLHGIISDNQLLEYTIPDELIDENPAFAVLMMEADKYIGYPYVYGASNPKEGFDCSGFVCWVYIRSGIYNTGRRGATGLHTLCTEVDPEEVRPGDLVFFHGTMGPEVKGITHVGIYVGNHMMIHAGDPVGFADLEDERWQKVFDSYGRLPFEEDADE